MPELPEVETVKNQLAPHIIGRTITKVTLHWERMVKGQDATEFLRLVTGQKIMDMTRQGKYLIVHLSNGSKLIIHLKMTGSLLLGKQIADLKMVRGLNKGSISKVSTDPSSDTPTTVELLVPKSIPAYMTPPSR